MVENKDNNGIWKQNVDWLHQKGRNMKYIAFGIGKIYERYCNDNIKKDIIAYTDNKDAGVNEFEGKPFIKPLQVSEWTYDYILIFSTKFFEEIYEQLMNELGVQEDKIVSFWDIVNEDRHVALQRCSKDILELVEKMQWEKVLDYTAFFSSLYYNKEDLGLGKVIGVDAFVTQTEKVYPIHDNLYEKIFNLDNCVLPEYDAIICPYILSQKSHMQEGLPEKLIQNTRYLLIILLAGCGLEKGDKEYLFAKYGDVIYTQYKAHGKYFIIDTKPDNPKKSIKIYAVSHKEFKEPDVLLYEPFYVGIYGAEKEFQRSDSRGDNIAKYNLLINETTALYWLWKNAKEDYIGLCHYRRFFLQSEEKDIRNMLHEPFARASLEKYDIILPQPILFGNIKEQLARHVNPKAFEESWEIITHLMKVSQPDYIYAFEYFFHSAQIMYPYNMFVTRKEVIDSYCNWLFSFILDAAEAVNFSGYDEYSRRTIGFFVERLFNVWLLKQELKIKELPVLLVE